jgi:hypothetical protein
MNISEVFELQYLITQQRYGSDPLDEFEALLEQCEPIDDFERNSFKDTNDYTADNVKRVDPVPVLCLYMIDSNIYS